MMNKFLLFILMCIPVAAFADGDDIVWERAEMDASRTGVSVPSENDWDKTLGVVKCGKYYAPNGRVYKGGSIAKVAATVIEAQEFMAPVKKVIAYSPEAMTKYAPESPLGNWFADNLIRAVEKASGKKVDMSIGNYGGIRVDMPKGDVLVDDIRSMFPFKNDIIYLSVKGSEIRKILESMAAGRLQVLGGVRITIKDGKLLSTEIDGEPLDDEKLYGVATISFLLHGGDGLALADSAEEVIDYPIDIYEAMMGVIAEDTAAARPLTASCDGRVVIL